MHSVYLPQSDPGIYVYTVCLQLLAINGVGYLILSRKQTKRPYSEMLKTLVHGKVLMYGIMLSITESHYITSLVTTLDMVHKATLDNTNTEYQHRCLLHCLYGCSKMVKDEGRYTHGVRHHKRAWGTYRLPL